MVKNSFAKFTGMENILWFMFHLNIEQDKPSSRVDSIKILDLVSGLGTNRILIWQMYYIHFYFLRVERTLAKLKSNLQQPQS